MPARCEQTRGLCLGRKSIADKVLPVSQALISSLAQAWKGAGVGLVEGLPFPAAAGSTCSGLESTPGTAEAPEPRGPCSGPEHHPPFVGLQIIPVQPAKAHTWLKALSSPSLGCGHFAGRPGCCSVPLLQHLGHHCTHIGACPAPAESVGIVMLPPQPLHSLHRTDAGPGQG